MPKEGSSKLERLYYLPKPENKDWIDSMVSSLHQYVGTDPNFHGQIKSIEDSEEFSFNPKDLDTWKTEIQKSWETLVEFDCSTDNRKAPDYEGDYFYFRYEIRREELYLSVESTPRERVKSIVKDIEEKLKLSPASNINKPVNLSGRNNKYFTNEPLNPEWFANAFKILNACGQGRLEHFDGYYWLLATPDQSVIRRDLKTWQDEVFSRWDEIGNTSCWLDYRSLRFQFRCDLRRESVELSVEAGSEEKISEIFKELATKLNLKNVDNDAYTVHSSGLFEVADWRNKNFAEAVEKAVKMFVGAKPALMDAAVLTGDETRQVAPYQNLKDLYERLKKDEPYVEVNLRVEGTQGSALGIYADNIFIEDQKKRKAKRRTLRLKSSVDIKEFPTLSQYFSDRLTLQPLNNDEGEAAPAKKDDARWLKFALPIFTALVTLVISSAFWVAIFPKNELRIIVPSVEKGKTSELPDRKFPVEWVLDTEQWFRKTINRNAKGTVRVLKGGLIQEQSFLDASPGVMVTVKEDGIYDIEVISPESSVSDKVRVEIKSPQPK